MPCVGLCVLDATRTAGNSNVGQGSVCGYGSFKEDQNWQY